MKTVQLLTFLSIFLLALSTAAAQKKRPAPRATPRPAPAAVNPVVGVAKLQVSNQLYNVNVFVDKMGPIAIAIENADKDAAARRLKKEAVDANEANKKKLIAAIRGLGDGLVALETDFKTKPQLSAYVARIRGISTLSAQAEDSAIAGRFVAAKDPLRQVALKLNETLAVLPGPLPEGSNTSSSRPPASTTRSIPVSTGSQPVSPEIQNTANAKRDVAMGMTTDEVLQSTWGAPSNKRVSTTSNGTKEVWTYPGNRSLYFYNGKVTRIVK